MTDARVLRVEATGETVGEAKWNALRELERLDPTVDKSTVQFQVVSEGERGLLGVGYTPAQVIAVADRAEDAGPSDESALAAEVRELLERITEAFGIRCRIDLVESERELVATCSGPALGLLIGKHGQTIDAIQYLANAIVARSQPGEERKEVVVDASGYRARRRATIESLAVRSAEQVVSSGSRIELDPMTAIERKIVHVRLKTVRGVQTASDGTEPNRHVVISPAE